MKCKCDHRSCYCNLNISGFQRDSNPCPLHVRLPWVRIPLKPWNVFFFRAKICNCLNCNYNCGDHIFISSVFPQCKATSIQLSKIRWLIIKRNKKQRCQWFSRESTQILVIFSSPGVFIGSKEININAGVSHNTAHGCEGLLPNHCSSNPCPNYSTCQEEFDSYRCVCPAGYVGKHCVNVCSLKPCRNGRCEKTDTQKGFQCVCPKQYTGERKLHNLQFNFLDNKRWGGKGTH